MSPTDNQLRVIQFLRRTGEASLAELRQGLRLSHVTLRHHLDDLIRDGVVSPPDKRRRPGPGRPEHVYSLAAAADDVLPGNYRDLALALLGTLESRQGAEWIRRQLREAGAAAAAEIGAGVHRESQAFVPEVLAALEARGYLPGVGTWSGRRCVTFAHCPHLEAARASAAVCAFDQSLLETLLGEPVILFRQIAERDPQCIFLLGPQLRGA